jgi:hypothetical protein
MLTYQIIKQANGYLLECMGGPCKRGHERIETDGSSLEQTLTTLGVSRDQRATAMQELHSSLSATVIFDAKPMAPLPSLDS